VATRYTIDLNKSGKSWVLTNRSVSDAKGKSLSLKDAPEKLIELTDPGDEFLIRDSALDKGEGIRPAVRGPFDRESTIRILQDAAPVTTEE